MKFRFLSACILTSLCIVSSAGFARNPANVQPPTKASYKTESGDCNIPVDQFDMDVNNVRARLLDAGDMWWDLNTAHYEVPKGSRSSGVQYPQAIFAGAIWISGLDQGNNLKIAAQEYRQGTTDFWTGPLDNTGSVSAATCNVWDQHFNVYSDSIKILINLWKNSGKTPGQLLDASYLSQIPADVQHWPAKGNPSPFVSNLNLTGGNFAPFFDNDGDGIYNPLAGDYPSIYNNTYGCTTCGCNGNNSHNPVTSSPYADQMVFWLMNDKGGVHTATNGLPMGIQINTLAFAFTSSDEVNNMTFYRYNIINKSGSTFTQTYMTQFMDPDLGCSENDRIGCDTTRSLGVVYNGTLGGTTQQGSVSCDDKVACLTGAVGYGCDLPMLGCDFFEGPTDTAGHQLGMSSFGYFSRTGGNPVIDPSSAVQFRNYQVAKWRDGTDWSFGGNAYGGSSPTHFVYPGDPSVSTQWSECNPQTGPYIPASDRRFIETSGPFSFVSGATQNITIGVIFVQPAGGVGSNCPSFASIATADDKAQSLFDNCFNQLKGPSAPLLDIRELSQKIIINVSDDPSGNNVGESYAQVDPNRVIHGYVTGSGLDSMYRYQGYIIYQLANEQVSITDIGDATKAIPLAVYDIKDGVSHLVNWLQSYDPATGVYAWTKSLNTIPGVGTDLPNTGIKHSLIDSLDLFGGGQMVNHQTYYFGAVSFATNNFQIFDPNAVIPKGQTTPFLLGNNMTRYSAIPSDLTPENGGSQLKSNWGDPTKVLRLEGQGNGGNYISLTPATISKILDNPLNYTDTLEYSLGLDPIGFKVTDPLVLKEAQFVLKIHDTIPYNGVNVSTLAWWELTDVTNNKVIHSVRTLDIPYEQNIADDLGNEYGFSITLGTPFPVYTNVLDTMPVYGAIGGTVNFADSTKPWLSFVADDGDGSDVQNWIRSGTTYLNCTVPSGATADALCNVFSDSYNKVGGQVHFSDPNNIFDKMAGGTWAPYCLAANWSMSPVGGNQVVTSGRPLTVGGPGFKWDKYNDQAQSPRNNLDKLQSVDIVLTSDKSKWSKCVVFETGEHPQGADLDPNGQGYAPRKGMLRGHESIDINGTYSNDPTNTGLSYFPGYAINIETGQRLEVAFGEASDLRDQNGTDMIWNPTSQVLGSLNGGGAIPYTPIFGGKHFLYVLDIPYPPTTNGDIGGLDIQGILTDPGVYQSMVTNPTSQSYSPTVVGIYDHIMWTAMPYLTPGYSMLSYADGLIPNDVTIKLRVQKPYAKFGTSATPAAGDSFPSYTFSTVGLGAVQNKDSVAKSALDLIRIVPNPYYAYSAYETSANDTRVKVTNLPNICTIRIYTLDGTLVRTLSRSITGIDPATNKTIVISDGYNTDDKTGSSNLDNTVDWDLKNEKAIPVASGIYLFDINVPGVGHKTLKWFGAMRPADISNF